METWATKEGFFNCKVPQKRMTVPDLGDIWVRGLTAGQKDEYENMVMQYKAETRELKMSNARAVLMALTIYDQHGNRMFGDNHIGKLCQVPAVIADPILNVAKRLSGMATGEIEELVKNSEALADGASGLDSGSPSASDGPSARSEKD